MADEIIKYEFKPAVITVDFPAMQEKLDALLADFRGLTADNVESIDTKLAKSLRAELNGMSKQLNDARIAIKKEYEKPYEEFKARVDELIAQIKEPQKLLDDAIKARENEEKMERRLKLEATYEEFAPALIEVVPFDRILDPRWLNKSYGETKAENALTEKVAKIAKDRDALMKAQLRVPDETMAEFYKTLDAAAALAYDEERSKELERIAAMNAEIEANQAAQNAQIGEIEPGPNTYTHEHLEAEYEAQNEPVEVTHTVPLSRNDAIYRFSLEIPYTEFYTTINEATALKNHIAAILNVQPKMTKSPEPVKAVA